MTKTVVLVGALDTKGQDFAFIKGLIEQQGLQTLVVDFGVMGQPAFEAQVSRAEVAHAGGADLARLAQGDRKDEAMRIVAAGLTAVVTGLYAAGKLDGILGMGGSNGTSIATAAMRALPVGVPKVMVSTLGGGDVRAYMGGKDIIFIPSIVDVAGLNRHSRAIYTNAAGAIAGMVKLEKTAAPDEKPIVVASMFGNTTPCVNHAKEIIEKAGYEVLVFHATGTGGKTMEGLIADGYSVASLDITTTELADEVCGGVFNAGPERCLAAARAGIPTVLVPGCVDIASFWGLEGVPEKYKARKLYEWNPNVTLMRTDVAENIRIGEMLAAAANASKGPVAVMLPLRGVSMLDSPGGQYWDPEADGACFDAIKNNLRPGIPILELDHNINDPEFSETVAETLLGMLKDTPDPNTRP